MYDLYESDKLKAILISDNKPLELKKYDYDNIMYEKMSDAWSLGFKKEDSPEIIEVKKQIEDYNNYIDKLNEIPDFLDIFKKNNYMLSVQTALSIWPKETVKTIFNRKKYIFKTQLFVYDKYLFNLDYEPQYEVTIDDERIQFKVASESTDSPLKTDKNYLFWGYYGSDLRDVTYYAWCVFDDLKICPGWYSDETIEELEKNYAYFDAYEQARYDIEYPDPNILRCLKLLKDYGYFKLYHVCDDTNRPLWRLRNKPDGTIDLGFLDKTFVDDKLMMKKLKVLLWASEENIKTKKYFLVDANNDLYLSDEPGILGGHDKLKIYGELNCPSANRALANG